MVRSDRVGYFGLFLELFGQLHADDRVRQLRLVVGNLAYVVQQSGTPGQLGVQTELGGHDAAQVGYLARVLEQVLSVGRAVFHFADEPDQLGVQSVYAQIDCRPLAGLDDLFLDLLLHLGYDLFDTRRVDASVGHELVQREPGDFAANGIEARQDDRFGRVVDDDLDAGGCLQRPDITAFAADNAALHLVAVDIEDRDRVFDRRLGGHALNRLHDDFLGLFAGGHLGLFHDFVDVGHRLGLGLGLHVFDQDVLRFLAAQSADLLEPDVLLFDLAVELLLAPLDALKLRIEVLAGRVDLLGFFRKLLLLGEQVAFDLLGALLALRYFLVPLVDRAVVFALELNELFLGLENPLLLDHFSFGLRLLDDLLAPFPDDLRSDLRGGIAGDGRGDERYDYNC